jgi:hypothetical protein
MPTTQAGLSGRREAQVRFVEPCVVEQTTAEPGFGRRAFD